VYSGRITAEIPQSGEVAQGSGLQARSITKSTAARFKHLQKAAIYLLCNQGGPRRCDWGDCTKVTLFTMILCNSENSIRDIRPFCRPLFFHSSGVKNTSSLLQ